MPDDVLPQSYLTPCPTAGLLMQPSVVPTLSISMLMFKIKKKKRGGGRGRGGREGRGTTTKYCGWVNMLTLLILRNPIVSYIPNMTKAFTYVIC